MKMSTQINIIDRRKQIRLMNSLSKYLKSKRKALEATYGAEKTRAIFKVANEVYPEIVCCVPTFKSSMYDTLMELASKMAALKKGMKAVGISTGEFVKFNIEQTRSSAEKVPKFLRKLGGKIYLSRPMRQYLSRVARRVTNNGWPTQFKNGGKHDDFTMSIETRNCQMVAFWESLGEGDIRPYCTFFDFTSAEALGIGLRQVSDIDTGVCKYCFYKNSNVYWPDSIQRILAN
jgi:hypothetical protein